MSECDPSTDICEQANNTTNTAAGTDSGPGFLDGYLAYANFLGGIATYLPNFLAIFAFAAQALTGGDASGLSLLRLVYYVP